MSYALSITEAFNYLLQQMAELENQATVGERIREASHHVPQEDVADPVQAPLLTFILRVLMD